MTVMLAAAAEAVARAFSPVSSVNEGAHVRFRISVREYAFVLRLILYHK